MNKESFDKIVKDLATRISMCEKKLDNIASKETLLNISLKEFIELRNYCQEEQGRMDKVNNDLYHLIGMGGLTPIQLQKFCGLVKRYLVYRSDIKYLACLSTIDLNINFPQASDYKTYLGQIRLTSEPRSKK
jgi:hypothetical protein